MSSRVLVSLRVKAPPERAFNAFVSEIGAWWRPSALFLTRHGEWWQTLLGSYKAGPGGTVR